MKYEQFLLTPLYVLWPTLLFILVISTIASLVSRLVSRIGINGQTALITAFTCLGGILGVIAGASRTPSIGVILPALLTIITILLGYWSGKEGLSEWRPIIPYCIIVLMLSAFYGLFAGATIRMENEQYEKAYEKRMLLYKEVELPLLKAKKLFEIENQKVNEKAKGNNKSDIPNTSIQSGQD